MAQQFEIVEYDHSYAAALADMWTRSGDSWGGFNVEMTAESVRLEEETSPAVNCLLAVADDEVVGYCKIGKWTQNEGALYVETLNVRPDMHGKKIGKALMLRSVDLTAKLGWARLDLHTWPGNTKAVPLYKRTGFFWEERDSEVYCVNFMPAILNNQIVSDYFGRADWYADSTREIEVKPDGREENKFTYFTYSWDKDGERLRMEYARRGRGLRKIECNEFDVEVTVEDRDLVFGKDYEVIFSFKNKSSTPLEIAIDGKDDKNLRFDFSYKGSVDQVLEVTGRFSVGEVEKDQDNWKTHPRVCAEISINGKSTLFAVGVVPKFPARIRFIDPKLPLIGSDASCGYLDVESNLSEKADFVFKLENHDAVCFAVPSIECTLEAGDRKSLRVPVRVDRSCVYSGVVHATAQGANGDKIAFTREIGGLFVRPGDTYGGTLPERRDERSEIIGLGPHVAGLKLERNSHINGVAVSALNRRGSVHFFPFQLGKPYDDEFIRNPPTAVESKEHADGREMIAQYESSKYPGLQIGMHVRIDHSGMVRRWFSFSNTTNRAFDSDLFLTEKFRANGGNAALPFDGKILEARSETHAGYGLWQGDRLSENWMFNHSGDATIGIFWEPEATVTTAEWFLAAEHNVGKLNPGEVKTTPAITAAVDVFETWNECRSFAIGKYATFDPVEETLELCVNNHNPFVLSPYEVELTEHKLKNFEGTIGVSSTNGSRDGQSKKFDRAEGQKSVSFELGTNERTAMETVEVAVDLVPLSYNRSRVVFPVGEGDVTARSDTAEGYKTIVASNGLLEIRCAPGYAPGLISCTHLGAEWLDSGFPKLAPKDWWNPWVGGAMFFPAQLEARPLIREPATAKTVELTDSKGNQWKGIQVTVTFREHEDLRGLEYDQFFMMLPQVPVLMMQARVRQNTGTHFKDFQLVSEICPLGSENPSDITLEFLNNERQHARINSGHEELGVQPESCILVADRLRASKMIHYADRRRCHVDGETQKHATLLRTRDSVDCADREAKSVPPRFLIFSEGWIEEEHLADLRYIDLLGGSPS
jgi:ribosomal protein S18 acetylase RimI-like enzyme